MDGMNEGAEPPREAAQASTSEDLAAPVLLELGSDVEMARLLVAQLRDRCRGHVIADNGSIYGWTGTRWQAVDDALIRRVAHGFDGAVYGWTAKGEPKQIKLGMGRVDSIIHEARAMLAAHGTQDTARHIVDDAAQDPRGFFDDAPAGINCASGFIRIHCDGGVELLPHSPEHRQRHTLPARWQPVAYDGCSDFYLPPTSLLSSLLDGAFRDDEDADEKAALLQEVAGCAIARHSTRLKKAKFVLLFGPSANNGKSQILDMLASMFPPASVGAVSVEDWGDEKHRAALQDVAFNAVGELRGAAIQSAAFKEIVVGDMVSARDVYRSAVRFRPSALHLAATNKLPSFAGGVDRGVQARLLPIPFNRSIPREEQIEGIGRRIATEEADLLLAWAVEGARRVVPRGEYAVPASCDEALTGWVRSADPVLDWLGECCRLEPSAPMVPASDLMAEFLAWARAAGHRDERFLPNVREFMARLEAQPGVQRARSSQARGLAGLKVIHGGAARRWGT